MNLPAWSDSIASLPDRLQRFAVGVLMLGLSGLIAPASLASLIQFLSIHIRSLVYYIFLLYFRFHLFIDVFLIIFACPMEDGESDQDGVIIPL